jgi:catechol 2,3-dioxygenase-like lactoylglutathione lyase family enzyme
MIEGLHHIGVAVRSLTEALPHWTAGLGLRLEGVEEVPTERVRVAILWGGGSSSSRRIEPRSTSGQARGRRSRAHRARAHRPARRPGQFVEIDRFVVHRCRDFGMDARRTRSSATAW